MVSFLKFLEQPAQMSMSNAARLKRKRGKKQTKLYFKSLPVTKTRSPYAGRSGERADQMKRSFNVSLRDMVGRPVRQPKLSTDDVDMPKIPNVKVDATRNPDRCQGGCYHRSTYKHQHLNDGIRLRVNDCREYE